MSNCRSAHLSTAYRSSRSTGPRIARPSSCRCCPDLRSPTGRSSANHWFDDDLPGRRKGAVVGQTPESTRVSCWRDIRSVRRASHSKAEAADPVSLSEEPTAGSGSRPPSFRRGSTMRPLIQERSEVGGFRLIPHDHSTPHQWVRTPRDGPRAAVFLLPVARSIHSRNVCAGVSWSSGSVAAHVRHTGGSGGAKGPACEVKYS